MNAMEPNPNPNPDPSPSPNPNPNPNSRQEHLKWQERQFKAQTRALNSARVNRRLEKKFESKEALEAR